MKKLLFSWELIDTRTQKPFSLNNQLPNWTDGKAEHHNKVLSKAPKLSHLLYVKLPYAPIVVE